MQKIVLILLFTITSCAGYRFQNKNNPFKQYGIKSLSIPMFYNQSALSNISGVFTKEIYRMVSGFDGLQVTGGKAKTDATLIGILESSGRIIDVLVPSAPRNVENIATDEVAGSRKEFYIPSASTVNLSLRVIVIKDPTKEEIEFLRSKASKKTFESSKIIFSESIRLSNTFTREVFDGNNNAVIHSQNRGSLTKSYIAMSRDAAQTFREMILYAF
jgi:hypothetical protein